MVPRLSWESEAEVESGWPELAWRGLGRWGEETSLALSWHPGPRQASAGQTEGEYCLLSPMTAAPEALALPCRHRSQLSSVYSYCG